MAQWCNAQENRALKKINFMRVFQSLPISQNYGKTWKQSLYPERMQASCSTPESYSPLWAMTWTGQFSENLIELADFTLDKDGKWKYMKLPTEFALPPSPAGTDQCDLHSINSGGKSHCTFPSTPYLPWQMWHPLAWSNGCSFSHAHKGPRFVSLTCYSYDSLKWWL